MKNSNVEQLLSTIEKRTETVQERLKFFGIDDRLTYASFHELMGLKEAFKIVTGKTITEYVLLSESEFDRED